MIEKNNHRKLNLPVLKIKPSSLSQFTKYQNDDIVENLVNKVALIKEAV